MRRTSFGTAGAKERCDSAILTRHRVDVVIVLHGVPSARCHRHSSRQASGSRPAAGSATRVSARCLNFGGLGLVAAEHVREQAAAHSRAASGSARCSCSESPGCRDRHRRTRRHVRASAPSRAGSTDARLPATSSGRSVLALRGGLARRCCVGILRPVRRQALGRLASGGGRSIFGGTTSGERSR